MRGMFGEERFLGPRLLSSCKQDTIFSANVFQFCFGHIALCPQPLDLFEKIILSAHDLPARPAQRKIA